MIAFDKPTNLDGALLVQELEAAGINVEPNGIGIKCPTLDGAGVLWLPISEADQDAAAEVVAAHNCAS
jgi:hypothetical protein